MPLADIQLQNKIEQLVNASLQSGQYPNLDVLRAEVLSWQNLGLPETQAIAVSPGSISSSAQYNNFFSGVGDDISSVYQQAWELFDGERNTFIALSNQENALESSLLDLTHVANTANCFGDQFTSFDNIDLTQTTAYVDLAANEVELDNALALETLDLSGATATFTISSPYTTIETLSPVANVLDAADDQYWLSCVHEPTPGTITAQLVIDLGAVYTCNKVSLSPQGTPSTTVLSMSPDNGTWTTCSSLSPNTWLFAAAGIRYLQFTMTKPPDENDGGDYLVYFGMSNFQVYCTGYEETGDLVSQPFIIGDQIVNQIDLTTTIQTPPLTNVSTYVNFNGGIWMPISGSLSLKGGTAQSVAATSAQAETTVGGITLYDLYPGDMRVAPFSIGDVNGDGIINAADAELISQYCARLVTLTPTQLAAANVSGNSNGSVNSGDATLILEYIAGQITSFPAGGPFPISCSIWQPQLVVGTDKYLKMRSYINPNSISNNVPSLSAWQGISPYTRATTYHPKATFVDTTTYPNVANSTVNDNIFFYQFYLNLPAIQQWVNITCVSGYSYCLYLNGALIQVSGNRALLNTIDGLNEITLILYNYGAASPTSSDWSWDWNLSSQVVYANQAPYALVDYPILLYHTPPGINNYFALQQIGNAWVPTINFNPADYALSPADFVLNYQTPNTTLAQMRFKATLSRQVGAGSTTPVLHSYQIVLS
jgi:PAS domain-containing protein